MSTTIEAPPPELPQLTDGQIRASFMVAIPVTEILALNSLHQAGDEVPLSGFKQEGVRGIIARELRDERLVGQFDLWGEVVLYDPKQDKPINFEGELGGRVGTFTFSPNGRHR